jgi:hypothetical protein
MTAWQIRQVWWRPAWRAVCAGKVRASIPGAAGECQCEQAAGTTAGIPYDPCFLLTSTNLATPSSGWFPVATNYFDVTGTTSFTNLTTTGDPQRYFQPQVN